MPRIFLLSVQVSYKIKIECHATSQYVFMRSLSVNKLLTINKQVKQNTFRVVFYSYHENVYLEQFLNFLCFLINTKLNSRAYKTHNSLFTRLRMRISILIL